MFLRHEEEDEVCTLVSFNIDVYQPCGSRLIYID